LTTERSHDIISTSKERRNKEMTKVFYQVVSGDWFCGMHENFDTMKEAKKVYDEMKESDKTVWGGLVKVTITKKWFKKENVSEEYLESFSREED
jgi:hypothetical protein